VYSPLAVNLQSHDSVLLALYNISISNSLWKRNLPSFLSYSTAARWRSLLYRE